MGSSLIKMLSFKRMVEVMCLLIKVTISRMSYAERGCTAGCTMGNCRFLSKQSNLNTESTPMFSNLDSSHKSSSDCPTGFFVILYW